MKRSTVARLAIVATLAVCGVGALTVGMADAATAASVQHTVPSMLTPHAGVDDFTFASLDAQFLLGRNAEGNSIVDVTETFVANFPQSDQNRGIRRAIPLKYDGHPTALSVESVTDETGAPRSFETESDEDDEFLLVTIAADDYVHGAQTYVLHYTQENITLDPDNSDLQEFYRDVNGVGWAQPFDVVTATVSMDASLGSAFADQAACYQGPEGSSQQCDDLSIAQSSPPTITATARNLAAYENLTVAVAFEAGTFVPRDGSLTASPAGMVGLGAAIASLGVLAAALVMRVRRWRNAPGRGTVIAEYEPPANIDPLLASELLGKANKGVSATILDLAVSGAISIIETKKKRFSVELRDASVARPEERAVLDALFGASAQPGARHKLGSTDNTLASKLMVILSATKKRATSSGFRRRVDAGARAGIALLAVAFAAVAVIFSIVAAIGDYGGGWPFGILVGAIIIGLFTLLIVGDVRPLTRQGAIAVEQLKGLELYIRLAEADRLRVLQSPSGALRDAVPTAPPGTEEQSIATASAPSLEQVLRLHEKLLPYSVLFGLEKEWSAELASLYARTSEPSWYAGTNGFNAAAFAVGVSSFASTSTATWSGSSSSSSSSGSSGGGYSGGGGGGGGGGGV